MPLRIDHIALNGDLGHYARVLADLDLSKPRRNTLVLDYETSLVTLDIIYERLPAFYHSCNVIGHATIDCRLLGQSRASPKTEDKEDHPRPPREESSPRVLPHSSKRESTSPIQTPQNNLPPAEHPILEGSFVPHAV